MSFMDELHILWAPYINKAQKIWGYLRSKEDFLSNFGVKISKEPPKHFAFRIKFDKEKIDTLSLAAFKSITEISISYPPDTTEQEIAIFCNEEIMYFDEIGYFDVKRIQYPDPEPGTLHEILRLVGGPCYICGNFLELCDQHDIIFGIKNFAHDLCLITKKDHKKFLADDPEILAMKKVSKWQPFLYYDEIIKKIIEEKEENEDRKISAAEIIKIIEENEKNEDIKISVAELKKIIEEKEENEDIKISDIKISVTGPEKSKENGGIKISAIEPQKTKENEDIKIRFKELRKAINDAAERKFSWTSETSYNYYN